MEMHATNRLLRWWPFILILFTLPSAGQDVLRKRVTLPAVRFSAEQLRKEISRQTGLQFSFGPSTIHPHQPIKLTRNIFTTKELLDIMQMQLKAAYKLYGDHVIFTKRIVSKSPGTNTATGKAQPLLNGKLNSPGTMKPSVDVKGATGNALSSNRNTNNTPIKSASNTTQAAVNSDSTSANIAIIISRTNSNPPAALATARADERLRQTAYRSAPLRNAIPGKLTGAGNLSSATIQSTRRNKKENKIFTRYTTVGIEVTEYFIANAVFKGGIPFLHGIIGYSSNVSHGSLRYGAGARYSFNETWHAQASFTSGKVVKNFQADSAGFGSKWVEITERLHRIGLQAERTVGKRWSLVAGVSGTCSTGSIPKAGSAWRRVTASSMNRFLHRDTGRLNLSTPPPPHSMRRAKPGRIAGRVFSSGHTYVSDLFYNRFRV